MTAYQILVDLGLLVLFGVGAVVFLLAVAISLIYFTEWRERRRAIREAIRTATRDRIEAEPMYDDQYREGD